MKLVYLGLAFIMVTVSTRGNNLSKRVTDLLQEVIDESKKGDQSDDLNEFEDDKDVTQLIKKESNSPHHSDKPHIVTDSLEDVIDENNAKKHAKSENMDEMGGGATSTKYVQKKKKSHHRRDSKLVKKVKYLMKALSDKGGKDDQSADLKELKDTASKGVQDAKGEAEATNHGGKLTRKITDLLQEIVDDSNVANRTESHDTRKRDHPKQCAGDAFDKAVDNIAKIVKEGIVDKLVEDFNQKFDDDEEEIYKKVKKDSEKRETTKI